MAENKLIIGSLPVLRGAYDSATNYYRDNQVTMYGSTFQSLVDENVGYPPAELREDGKVYAINTDKWIIVANAIDAYNAGERIANAETRIKELGEYADSPEFIRAYTDAEGKFLWGIRIDGSIEWAKGVPTPVKEALRELESKINTDNNGKFEEIETSLVALQDAVDVINASLKPLTDTFSFQDSPEFVNVVTDADGKVLFGLTAEGKPYFPKNEVYSVESNQEFLAAWLDATGLVLFGLRQDGSTYVAKADFLTKIEEIMKLLDENSIKDEEIATQVKQLQDTFSIVSNDEWLHAVVDAEGKLLFGIKVENGEVVMPKQDTYKVVSNDEWLAAWLDATNKILFGVKADGTFWAAKHHFSTGGSSDVDAEIEAINSTLSDMQEDLSNLKETVKEFQQGNEAMQMLSVSDDVEGRMEMTLDADGRILSYRDKDGVKHEGKGVDTSKYYQNGQEKDFVNRDEVADEITKAAENGAVKLENVEGVSNHNTPNLLIAAEMEKTFYDGVNSFTPPNEGYEMSNPIECKAGDWFTRTGTATGMVVVSDENDKNGTRLFNADGTTLGSTFQIPVDMTWVRYIRMAADVTGAQSGTTIICKGKKAYTGDDEGNFLTIDKLRIQNSNIPKDLKYLKSPDGKYWEIYVDESYELHIKEVDPNIITELPSDFPVYDISGDFSGSFKTWVSMVGKYLVERNENGVIKFCKLGDNAEYFADFRKEKSLSGETRYVVNFGNLYQSTNGEKGLTIYDSDFNVIDTNIYKPLDSHDFVYFDDDHIAGIVWEQSTTNINIPINQEATSFVTINPFSASIVELKKDLSGTWNVIGRFSVKDYPQLCTDEFGIYGDKDILEIHPNTLFLDYDGNYVLNLRNNDSFVKIKRTENSDGTVTIGSKTLDYDEAIIGRVGGKYNSGYIDSKRVLEQGFEFMDKPSTLTERSADSQPLWKWFHAHDVAYWGMKMIDGQQYPTYTLFDNNMWTSSERTSNYNDINPRNNYLNNPNGNNDTRYNTNKSDDGGAYDTHMISRVVQLSIDWENHLIKDYRVYIIPKQYSYTRSGAQMFEEGILLISWADQNICGLYDFNNEQTEVSGNIYKNGKELFKATINKAGFYRVHGYSNDD